LSNFATAAELLDGQGFDIAGGKLSPELTVKEFHDDNLTNAAAGEIDTFGTYIAPHLTYELKNNKNRYTLDYLFEAATHYSSHNDDYIDQTVQAGYEYTPTSRISTGIDFEYYNGHDDRGTGAAEGTGAVQSSFDRYHHYRIDGNAAYGAESAKAQFELDLGHVEKDYDNNFAATSVRDREDHYGSARLYYRVMPKTRAVLEGRVTEYKYERDAAGTASLDSTTSRALAGVTWESTYKTTGTAQIGYIQKNFDSGARADGEEITWELGVEWKPKSYITFNLDTSRDFVETNGAGNFTQEDKVTASYAHEWSSKITTLVDMNYQENTFDQDTTGRSDDLFSAGVSVDYEMRRWLKFGAGYSYDERDSTISSFDYERNIVEAFATVVF
jgi:polysaccharide biosynthesis protein VpsM